MKFIIFLLFLKQLITRYLDKEINKVFLFHSILPYSMFSSDISKQTWFLCSREPYGKRLRWAAVSPMRSLCASGYPELELGAEAMPADPGAPAELKLISEGN